MTLRNDPAVDRILDQLVEEKFASHLFEQHAGLWGPEAAQEAAVRLGWTDFEAEAAELFPRIEALRHDFVSRGIDHFVLCGMGGSSLAPAVIARWSGVELTVLDSTHPGAVSRALSADLSRTAVIVSSKSGGTIETRSLLAAFARAFERGGHDVASHLVVVTDPGSQLDFDSQERGYALFHANPNVGGRFSALTAFGLVPAGLAGADIRRLVRNAAQARAALVHDQPENPGLRLAAAIAAGLPQLYVLAVSSERDAGWGLGSWIEQLVAESTGKRGKGVLPISLDAEAPEFCDLPRNTRAVRIAGPVSTDSHGIEVELGESLRVSASLGAQFLLWECATAALGRIMRIDPFNQPDVEAAKLAARNVLASPPASSGDQSENLEPAEVLPSLRAALSPEGYLAIQAFLDPRADYAARLEQLRNALAARLHAPVALGWGPSYLHSTGQLHKGGPRLGVFLQLLDDGPEALDIPDAESGFETLIAAQAKGDREVLRERGSPVFVIKTADASATIDAILAALKNEH